MDIQVGVVVEEKTANHVAGDLVLLRLPQKLQHNLAQVVLDLCVLGLFLFDAKPNELIEGVFRVRPGFVQREQKRP